MMFKRFLKLRALRVLGLFIGMRCLFIVWPSLIDAKVVINEFSSGTTSDWVEFYNTSTESADLSIYKLRDSSTSNSKNLTGTLGGLNFSSITFSNYLNNNGDTIKLIEIIDSKETEVDSISYGSGGVICAANSNQSIGRKPDGTGNFVRFSSSTKDLSNTSPEDPCPTPTPTNTPTPTPIQTPTSIATATPIPTKTPTPTATPKKTVTPTPKSTLSALSTPSNEDTLDQSLAGDQVLGLRNQLSDPPSASPSANETKNKIPVFAYIFLVTGAIVLGFGGYLFIIGRGKKEYNKMTDIKNEEL